MPATCYCEPIKSGLVRPEFADIVLEQSPMAAFCDWAMWAIIRDGFVDEDVIQQFNGQQSLPVKVEKSEAEDALFIAAQLKAFLSSYQAPAGTSVEIWDDQTTILEQRLSLIGAQRAARVCLWSSCSSWSCWICAWRPG